MPSRLMRRAAAVSATAVLTVSPLLVATPAEAAPLPCRASMSNATPKQYSNVYVRVRTAARAKVRTVAHYRTTKTTKRGKANAKGRASIKYYISGATPGYTVRVVVTVTKNGKKNTCKTSFRPRR